MIRKPLPTHIPRCAFRTIALGTMFLCFAPGFIWSAAQTVVFNIECANAVDRGVRVERQDFTDAQVETLAHDFLREHGADKLISLLVGVDQQQILSSHHGVIRIIDSSEEDPHAGVAKEIESRRKSGPPTGPLARLIAIRGAGLLSITKNGVITERLIGGESDPTSLEQSGVKYKLLHLNLSAASEAVRGHCVLSVFLQTGSRLSVSGLVALTRRFQVLTGVQDVETNLRRDSWFLGDQKFPIMPAFSRDLTFRTHFDGRWRQCWVAGSKIRDQFVVDRILGHDSGDRPNFSAFTQF
jgi:hypothetical protein